MLCTRCSDPIKPVVAIDIDGTLGDYHGHFLNFAYAYTGHPVLPKSLVYDGEQQFRYWFVQAFGSDIGQQWHDIKLAYRQGAQKRSMPVYEGAAELVNGLISEGAEVWLTTTRPYLRLDSIDPDTRAWLDRHDIRYHHLLYDDHKYSQLEQRVDPARVVAVLDDLDEDWERAWQIFGPDVPVFRRNGYNRAVKLPHGHTFEAINLHDAFNLIAGRVRNFNEAMARRQQGE